MSEKERNRDVAGRLLEGRTGFSRAEHDAIFEDVFAEVEAKAAEEAAAETGLPWWVTVLGWAVALALIAGPVAWWVAKQRPPDEFTARGADGANLQLRCTGDECMVGEMLLFELSGTERAYFSAFARNGDGAVVWYFPEHPGEESIAVEDGLVNRSVHLGGEHEPGEWTVYALLSDDPMTREEIRRAFDDRGELQLGDVELMTRTLKMK